MTQKIGTVVEVYILEDNSKIGFKISIDGEMINVITEQNKMTSNIFKDDKVILIKQVIDSKTFYDLVGLVDKQYG